MIADAVFLRLGWMRWGCWMVGSGGDASSTVRMGILSGGDASSTVGIGILLRVLRWWMNVVALMVRCAVGSAEDDWWVPTLGAGWVPTLGAGPLSRIAVSCWSAVACLAFIAALLGIVVFNSFTNSVAAIIVLSASEIVGVVQCAG